MNNAIKFEFRVKIDMIAVEGVLDNDEGMLKIIHNFGIS